MTTRRDMLGGGVLGLGAALLPEAQAQAKGGAASSNADAAPSTPAAPQGRRPPGQPPMRPISTEDFRAPAGTAPAPRSAAYEEKKPHLFEGLTPRFATAAIKSRFIPMRDGVRLATDFYIPLGAETPLPVILIRTPYSKNTTTAPLRAVFPEQGFILAIQDVRGRYESEGEFIANAGTEREDGWDTVEWLAHQPWCNGKIGAWGSSYLGETAARLSAMRHPNHKASIIMFDGSNVQGEIRNGAFTQGGITLLRELFTWFKDYVPAISYGPPPHVDREWWFAQPFAQTYSTQPVKLPPVDLDKHLRTLPVATLLDRAGAPPTEFTEMMRHSNDPTDPYWKRQQFLTDADHFDVPALHVAGLAERGDSAFANFELFSRNGRTDAARNHQHLLYAPTPHSGYMSGSEHFVWGARDFGDTRFPYLKTFVDWFAHWLRDEPNAVTSWPKVRWYAAGANVWRSAQSWPPKNTETVRFYLRGSGGTAHRRAEGRLSLDGPLAKDLTAHYRYDPADPTPSEPPGAELDSLGDGYGDFSALAQRPDVLVYTSEPLTHAVELAGRVSLHLHVSSSAKDTDFAAQLLELDDQGRAINVTQGIARARYREGLDKQMFMSPGGVYLVTLDLWFGAIRFAPGRRIRLHVSSCSFPFYDRNLNTGGNNYTDTDHVVADNTIHHDKAHPSWLSLTVLKA